MGFFQFRVLNLAKPAPSVLILELRFPLSLIQVTELSLLCSPVRRERAQKFHFEEDAIRCLAAGWLLAQTTRYNGLRFLGEATNEAGKPYLIGHPNYQISITHSGPWIACALHKDLVGVDLENCVTFYEYFSNVFMSSEELHVYKKLPCSSRKKYFYELWTMKEAYFKATGLEWLEPPQDWRKHLVMLSDQFKLALCWRS